MSRMRSFAVPLTGWKCSPLVEASTLRTAGVRAFVNRPQVRLSFVVSRGFTGGSPKASMVYRERLIERGAESAAALWAAANAEIG